MISEKIAETINKQINHEMSSAYLYLSMSAYFESISLKGFAEWMRVQYQEEVGHAMKLYSYLAERGGRIRLEQISAPQAEWGSPLEAFENALEHERKVTGLINSLVNLAAEHKDHATTSFLKWFVDEQVEEEAMAEEIVNKLRLVSGSPGGLYMLDKELMSRKSE